MRMGAALRLDGEMAAREVAGADLVERGMFALAALPRVRAAIAKAAAGWPVGRSRDGAGDYREAAAGRADARHRAEQSLGVRMVRGGEDLAHRRFLDDLAGVHH